MTETNVHYHVEDGVGRPAINVKVRAPGAAFWPTLGDGADDILERVMAAANERIASDFWQAAEEIATQRGLGEIAQEGRSGGWLVFTDDRPSTWAEDAAAGRVHLLGEARDWLAGYRSMVEWADAWIADAPRKVAALAQQLAMDEAGEEPARRMFPAAFGGCNGHSIYYASVARGQAIMAGYELQDDDDDRPAGRADRWNWA